MRFLLHGLFGLTLIGSAAPVWGQATPTPPTVAGIFTDFKDIGVTPKAGSIHYDKDSGEYHVTGGGANVWGTQDAFAFLYQKITGDFSLTADVRFEGKGAVAHRKAMLMARQDVTPGLPYADAALHGDGLTSLQYRPAADAATLELRSTITAPSHLRLERHGNDFTIRVGPEGMATGPQTVTMNGPVFVGLAVCSHDANVLETAVFSNVLAGARTAASARAVSVRCCPAEEVPQQDHDLQPGDEAKPDGVYRRRRDRGAQLVA